MRISIRKKILIAVLLSLFSVSEIVAQPEEAQINNTNNGIVEIIQSTILSERSITTVVIIGELSLLLLILYYWKKTNNDAKIENTKSLKRNIRALRNESIKLIYAENDHERRLKIFRAMNRKQMDGKLLTATAKKLEVSKGEVLLVAKINQLKSKVR